MKEKDDYKKYDEGIRVKNHGIISLKAVKY
jgi:hypothetical protein